MLRRRILLLAVLMASLTGLVFASDDTGNKNHAKLFDATTSENRIAADLKYLSSEELEGRGSTTQGIHKAADYIVSMLGPGEYPHGSYPPGTYPPGTYPPGGGPGVPGRPRDRRRPIAGERKVWQT